MFIYCYDEKTAHELLERGLVAMSEPNGEYYIFAVNSEMKYSELETYKGKIALTNQLYF